MAKFCAYCGKVMDDTAAVCFNCGRSANASQPSAQPAQPYIPASAPSPYSAPQQPPYNNAPQQPPYNAPYNPAQPPYNQPPAVPPKSGVSASLILGIVGCVAAFLFAIVGHITSIIGIVLGVKEYKTTGKKAGMIVSIVGEGLSLLSSILGAVLFSTLM